MRIALFSDIHGNYTGLRAVLNAIDAAGGVDMCVAAGDLVGGESGGDDLIELLVARGACLIRGDSDTEEKLLDAAQQARGRPGSTRSSHTYYDAMHAWLQQHVSAANRAMLAALPTELLVDVAPGQRLYVCHASPRSIGDRICAPLTHPDTVRAAYGAVDAAVIAFGHWHAPYVRWLDGRLYLNVASVAFQPDGMSRFTFLTYQDGQWIVEQQAVPYDGAAEAARMRARQVPQADA